MPGLYHDRALGWEGRMDVGGGDFQKAEFTGCVGDLSSTVELILAYQKCFKKYIYILNELP